jgi:phosphomannomutase
MLKINPQVFRAYDIRGIYGKDIDEDLFKKIGFVLGKEGKKFLVGHDIRESSQKLALALIEGLILKKSKVYFAGEVPFGLCFFSGSFLKVSKTLFVTASHLPPEWNGLKINFGDGEPISSKEIQKIKNGVLKIKKLKSLKNFSFARVNFEKEYFQALLSFFPEIKRKKLKIVLDCGNGATSLLAPKIFKNLGFNVKEMFCKPDPSFPNRASEPTFEATKDLRKKVIKEKADFGVAFDGDGDRAVIIDDKGKYLGGNEIGTILTKEMLKEGGQKKVVKTVATTMKIDEEVKKAKGKLIEVAVGHTFIIKTAKREKAILGIEESGHAVMPNYFLFDDGMLIPLKVAQILIKRKRKLSEIVRMAHFYFADSLSFACSDEKKFKIIKKMVMDFKKRYKKINTLDGLKIYFDFGWVLIRASNTSPKIRVYFEAKTKEKLERLKEIFSKEIEKWTKQ